MPVIRSGQYRPGDYWVSALRLLFRALGVGALVLGTLFFVVGVGLLSDAVTVERADVFFLGLPYIAFGLVGLWMAWRLLLYLESKDVKQVIQLICFGLFFMMLINLFTAWSAGAGMVWPLIYYGVGAIRLWLVARHLPPVVCAKLFPEMSEPV